MQNKAVLFDLNRSIVQFMDCEYEERENIYPQIRLVCMSFG